MNDVQIKITERTLSLDRRIDAPRTTIWRCWTEPDLLRQWFCPKPWGVSDVDFDVRPGGRMNIVMAGPSGERVENVGCWLSIEPERGATFTDYLAEGYVPREDGFMVGAFRLEDTGVGATRLHWEARHATATKAKAHLDMGFEAGWTAASAQLRDLAMTLTAMSKSAEKSAGAS